MDDLFGSGSRSAAHATNARVWDAYARNERRFARPVSDKEFTQRVQAVSSDPFLAGSLVGRQLLCLGSGGGMQSALYAAAGAHVTVVDISPEMLALDREVATDRGLMVTTVEASIDCLEAMPDALNSKKLSFAKPEYLKDLMGIGFMLSQHIMLEKEMLNAQ